MSVYRVVYSVLVESWDIIGPYQSWWLLNGLLLVLQVLHVFWFYLIARIAIKALFKGKVSLTGCVLSLYYLLVCLQLRKCATGLLLWLRCQRTSAVTLRAVRKRRATPIAGTRLT